MRGPYTREWLERDRELRERFARESEARAEQIRREGRSDRFHDIRAFRLIGFLSEQSRSFNQQEIPS